MTFYAQTNTITLSTTLTTPYPPSLLPLSVSFPTSSLATTAGTPIPSISYTTLTHPHPSSDPFDGKLAPVLVVTKEEVKIVDASGVLLESTQVVVIPQASPPGTEGQEGGMTGAGQKEVGRLGKMGWERWTWSERWGVIGVTCVAIMVLVAAAFWALWMKFQRGKDDANEETSGLVDKMQRRSHGRLNSVQTGETGFLRRFSRFGAGSSLTDDARHGSGSGNHASLHGRRGDSQVQRTTQEKVPISIFED